MQIPEPEPWQPCWGVLSLFGMRLACNVNPGLINPKRLVNWGGTIEVLDEMTIGGVPP